MDVSIDMRLVGPLSFGSAALSRHRIDLKHQRKVQFNERANH